LDNIDNILGKFNNILKDKNIDLNSILSDEEKEAGNSSDSSNNSDSDSQMDFNFDLDTILKMKQIFNKINSNNNNPRNTLLNSLKPFLREDRKKKLNQYIQISNLLGIISLLNENSGDEN
jgi:hypothetical protein